MLDMHIQSSKRPNFHSSLIVVVQTCTVETEQELLEDVPLHSYNTNWAVINGEHRTCLGETTKVCVPVYTVETMSTCHVTVLCVCVCVRACVRVSQAMFT